MILTLEVEEINFPNDYQFNTFETHYSPTASLLITTNIDDTFALIASKNSEDDVCIDSLTGAQLVTAWYALAGWLVGPTKGRPKIHIKKDRVANLMLAAYPELRNAVIID